MSSKVLYKHYYGVKYSISGDIINTSVVTEKTWI